MASGQSDGCPSPQPPCVARGTSSRPGSARIHRPVSPKGPATQRPASASNHRIVSASSSASRRPGSAGSQRPGRDHSPGPQSPAIAQEKKTGRPAFLGGQMVATTWCRSWGQRALEEELKPLPLTSVPVHMATPLEAQFAAALGISELEHWPRLPLEVGSCEQGNRCCWRWLARAALEQVAGKPLGQLSLPEAVASLRDEMADLEEQRRWRETAEAELEEYMKMKYDFDKFRVQHEACMCELQEFRAADAGVAQMRLELNDQYEKNGKLSAAHRNMQAEIVSLKAKHQILIEGDLRAAQKRAESAEGEMHKIVQSKIEHKLLNDDLNRQLLSLRQEVSLLKQENTVLQQKKQEEATAQKKRRRRRVKSAVPRFRK